MFTLNVKAGATDLAGYSSPIDLSAYANSSGASNNVLEAKWRILYNGGTINSITLQHSTDGSSYSTLWSCGDLSGDTRKVLYSWRGYLRVAYSFTAGTSTEDAGFRLAFDILPYGLPDWDSSAPCRWEHCKAIVPSWFDLADSFPPSYPSQRASAKRDLEIMLKAKGIDPSTLYLDAHVNEPVPIGLAIAGARRTLYYMMQDGQVVRGELWQEEMKRNEEEFRLAFDSACSSGLMLGDTAQTGRPSDSAPIGFSLQVTR